jgi:hypothetical protein
VFGRTSLERFVLSGNRCRRNGCLSAYLISSTVAVDPRFAAQVCCMACFGVLADRAASRSQRVFAVGVGWHPDIVQGVAVIVTAAAGDHAVARRGVVHRDVSRPRRRGPARWSDHGWGCLLNRTAGQEYACGRQLQSLQRESSLTTTPPLMPHATPGKAACRSWPRIHHRSKLGNRRSLIADWYYWAEARLVSNCAGAGIRRRQT